LNVKVNEVMTPDPVTTEPHKSVEHVRHQMQRSRIGVVPVVGPEGQPVGIVSASDLLKEPNANSPVKTVMSKNVLSVPLYEDVSVAARVMRKNRIHHLVVTHEKKLVGILSAFDLLALVEAHRWVPKNAPGTSGRKGKQRGH
jgi:CBS domain-containing protein